MTYFEVGRWVTVPQMLAGLPVVGHIHIGGRRAVLVDAREKQPKPVRFVITHVDREAGVITLRAS